MKSITAYLFALLMLFEFCQAGSLKIQNSSPRKGKDTVFIQYTGLKAKASKAKKMYLIVYNYTAEEIKPYAVQYPLEMLPSKSVLADSLSFKGFFVPKNDAVVLLMKVTDGYKYSDNNEGQYWEILPTELDGSLHKGQTLRRVASYCESLPNACARKQDFKKAFELLQNSQDVSLTGFQKDFYMNVIPFMEKKFNRDSLQKLMITTLQNNSINTESEAETRILVQALRILGKPDVADSIEKEYEYTHPMDEFSEDAAAARAFSKKTKDEFIVEADRFMKLYPNSYNVLRIAESFIRIQLKDGKLAQLTERFLRDPTLPTTPSLDLANAFLEVDSLKEALRWAERAVFYAQDESTVLQPKYLPPCEFAQERRAVISEALLAPAFINKKMKNYEKSLKLYKEAIDKYSDIYEVMQMTSIYQSMIELYDAMENQKEAYTLSKKAISSGFMSDKILSDHQKLFEFLKSQKTIRGDYATEIQDLKKLGNAAKLQLVLNDQLSISPVPGTLKTANGGSLTTDQWRGKVVFLDFWATWCGPCIKSFPGVQKLYDKYKNNPNVVFAIVNVWERVEDRFASVQSFLSKNPYSFPIYYDLKDEIVKEYGVTGIPSKFILDKDGVGRFMEVGLKDEQTFIEETSMKIDALLAQ